MATPLLHSWSCKGEEGRLRPSTLNLVIGGHYLIMSCIIYAFKFINNYVIRCHYCDKSVSV